jgi:hypothetical protein
MTFAKAITLAATLGINAARYSIGVDAGSGYARVGGGGSGVDVGMIPGVGVAKGSGVNVENTRRVGVGVGLPKSTFTSTLQVVKSNASIKISNRRV